jgi:hypothetical protein
MKMRASPGGLTVVFSFLLLFLPLLSCADSGKSPDAPQGYSLNRADDSYPGNPGSHTDIWDKLKAIPLNATGSWALSLGGEVRERYEFFNNPNWGGDPQDNGYLLQRYFLHGKLEMGGNLRFFSQLQSSLENGRAGGPRPTDKNELDLHQGFLDAKLELSGDAALTLRAGRQEMAYGSQRVIAVREGPNVRQAFDGFRLMYRSAEFRLDGFVTKPVQTKRYLFDDGPDNSKALWGGYAVLPFAPLAEGTIDLYYLGLYRSRAAFDQGVAAETRHSVGARLWRTAAPLDYNFEALYQWGRFGNGAIRAWTVASDTGYTLTARPLHPRFGLRADIASGDSDPSGKDLQTFNPLFPKGAYFSEAGLIGPANFIDVNPCLDLHLAKSTILIFDWDFFWRENIHDGLYNNAVVLVRTGKTSHARYIGSMAQAQLSWDIDRHLSLVGIYGHFFTGSFLKESGKGADVDYLTSWLTYKF